MPTRPEVVSRIERERIVAVLRLDEPEKLLPVVEALAEGGIRVFEITMSMPRAVDLIEQLASTLPPDRLLGAGTVTDPDTARRVIDAGAAFVVSPVFRRAILDACLARDVVGVPGCFSPTEILEAWDAGAGIVKVFPSTAVGPKFIRDLLAPLPQLKLMPTGGVSIDNAVEWLRAGAVAVGIGGAIVDSASVRAGDFAGVTQRAARLVASIGPRLGAPSP